MEEAKEKKSILKKIFNENYLPIILFLVVLINYLPLFINNINSKVSNAVGTKDMVSAFGIECILLFGFLITNLKFNKKFIINTALLIITTITLLLIQLKNYYAGIMQIMDLANIACITVNIAMLYVAFLNIHIEEKKIYKFFVGIVLIGIVACIVNIILYKKEMLRVLGIGSESLLQNVKSFFAHRNQFAMFLYFSIISSILLLIKTNKKMLKIVISVIIAFLGASLLITASRTGIACSLMFLGLFFILTDRLRIKTKLIIVLVGTILLLIGIYIAYNVYPDVWEKAIKVVEKVLIRENTIKTFTGRSIFWELAINLLFATPISAMFGVGRFVGIELIKNYNVTQFHNFYIEALVAGGIMELAYLLFIYVAVLRNVIKSKIDKRYKILYVCLYISYAIYCGFESLGRFSIGCADTMCLIFLVTMPLLHSNANCLEDEKIQKINKKLPYRRKKEEKGDK